LVSRAGDLQRGAGELTSIGAGLSGVWSGAAAQAAVAHHRRRSAEVDALAGVVHAAGQALIRAADGIAQARGSLQAALSAASASGCSVLDDGTVLPPARPPVPAGLSEQDRSAWQVQADATAAAQAAGAARLAAQIQAALTLAGAADDAGSAALWALQPPPVSAPPRPVPMGLSGGQWGLVPLPSCPVTAPAAVVPAPDEEDGAGFWSGLGHGVLDVAGLVPVLGEPADGINAIWYEAEGDHVNAALSAAGMVPFLGMGATAAKVGIKGVETAGEAATAARAAEAAQLRAAAWSSADQAVARSRYPRVGGFRQGVRDRVWKDSVEGSTGQVRDPLTGQFMSPAKPWHMGHKPGVEFRKQQRSAFEQNLPRETWRDWQNDPTHYRPELPSSNTSHRGEDHTDDYFGP